MNEVLTAKTEKHLLTVWYDDSKYMYDEIWNEVSFISNHNDYDDKGPNSHLRIEELIDGDIPEGLEIVPIRAYIHSGIALSIAGDKYQFDCPFDSGMFGFLVFNKGEFGSKNRGLEGFVRSWAALLNGEVYGFTLESISSCKCCSQSTNETIDCIGGFYSYIDYSDMIDAMLEYVDINETDMIALKNEVTKGY